jgi:hypothetical protein
MKQRRAFCPHPAVAFYDRPAQMVRVGRRVVDVVPRQMVKLCLTHRRAGDVLVDKVEGGLCGWGFNAPPQGGVFIETQERAKPRRGRGRR